jgi:hypothetical protein
MMGFHTVKLWQNGTFHCRNQMNNIIITIIIIIILTHNGKGGSKLSRQFCCRGANWLSIEMNFCVGLSFIFEPVWRIATAQASPQSSPR